MACAGVLGHPPCPISSEVVPLQRCAAQVPILTSSIRDKYRLGVSVPAERAGCAPQSRSMIRAERRTLALS